MLPIIRVSKARNNFICDKSFAKSCTHIFQISLEIVMFFFRENFEKLIDDKSFRSQLVMFAVDEEITVIEKDHRPGVMYILMRYIVTRCE